MSILKYYFSWNSIIVRVKNRKISNLSFFDKETNISYKALINRFCVLRKVVIDDYSYVGANSSLNNVVIGKYCSISNSVRIGLPTHPINHISTSPLFFSPLNGTGYSWANEKTFEDSPRQTIIGNDVWIGTNVSIMGGVNIGNGAIIGAHSLVTKDIEPYSIVGGVPAKIIRKRFNENIILELERSKWWELEEEKLKKMIKIFNENVSIDICNKLQDENSK